MNGGPGEEKGEWNLKQVLGQGGFGCVVLWEREGTQELIAIKKCRLQQDMSDKMWQRWKMEVYIMGKLNHDNVIRAVELPDELKPLPGEPPVLAMEYCEGGDLRKVLNRPENCCGLRESEIRQLVTGVGSAIEYLHSNRIIHRDLKPENIVLKKIDEHMTLYKIIDLGYAKELDINSICDSFVGTVQYLAPELFVSKPYSKTVDYWSFGSLVFECISGFRPFLPTSPPVEWHDEVRKKSPDDISAQYDDNRKIKLSKRLPTPNQLCKPLQGYFEQWLRLMLRWDPKARGGGVIRIQEEERPKCFFLLEQIMSLKIFHILHVEANTVLSYPVTESHTIANVHEAVAMETDIPVDQQVIILASGIILEASEFVVHHCSNPISDDIIVFLFRRGALKTELMKNKKIPLLVQGIAKEPTTLLPPKAHRKAWAQAVYWCTEQNRDYKRLAYSHKAALLCLLRTSSVINKRKAQMCSAVAKLMDCKDQFQINLNYDLQQYKENLEAADQVFNGANRGMYHQWTLMLQKIDAFNNLNDRVQNLDNKAMALSTEMVELQKSPFGKPGQSNELDEFEQKAKELYQDLCRTTQEGSHEIMDHTQMVGVVCKCYMKRDEITKTLHKHLNRVMDCLGQLEPIMPELMMACDEIDAADNQLFSMQRQRQTDIWRLLGHSVDLLMGGTGRNLPDLNVTTPYPGPSMTATLETLTSSAMESLQLMDDCKTNSQRLQGMVDTMLKEQEESILYFSSLDSTR